MHFTMFGIIAAAALAVAPVAVTAEDGCCDKPVMTCCDEQPCDMPCCNDHATHGDPVEPSAIEMLFTMDAEAILPSQMEATPVRQTAVVWFHRPVWVGDIVLLGKHVIEHDADRQARGEPCTHIYAAGDLNTPVATFHCTHLDRDRVEKDTVVLQSLPDGMRKLLEFQFAGEHAAHGFPTER